MASDSLSILIEAIDNASGRISKIEDSLNRLNKTAQKATLSDSLKATGKQMQDVGAKMTTHMTLPIVAGLGFAAKAAMDFESSLSDVNKVTGMQAGTDEARAFGAEIMKLTRTLPLAGTELASIAAAGGGLGVAQQDLIKFTELTAKMSTAFDMSADQAGTAIGKMMNLYSVGVGEAEDLGNSINLVSDRTSANASQMVDVATRIGGIATTFGLTADEAVGLGGAFLQAGGTAETAGTAINGMLSTLQTATLGGETFQAGLKRIGMSATELETAIATDAVGALDMFMGKLNELNPQERSKAIGQMFGKGTDSALITKLAGDMDMYRSTMKIATDETARAGSMQGEFQARSGTTSNQLQLLKNNLTEMGVNVGSVMLPAINSIATALSPLITGMAEFAAANPGITQVAVAFLLVVAALGPAIVVIGSIVAAVGVLIPVFMAIAAGIASAFAIISTGFTVVGLVFGALAAAITLPMIAVGLLVAGLIAGAVWVVTHWSQVKTFFSNLGMFIGVVFNAIRSKISMALGSALLEVQNRLGQLQAKFDVLKLRAQAAFDGIRQRAQTAVQGMISAFQGGVARVGSAMNSIKTTIISTLASAASGAMAAGRRIVTAIADGIRAGIGAVSSAASAVANAVKSKLPNSPVPEGPLRILNGTHNAGYKISQMVAGGMERGSGLIGGAADSTVSPVAMAASSGARPGGGGATVNYSPTINIGGNVSPEARADFMAMLRQHKDEIASMLGQQSARDEWLSYQA
jgi:TP901 family phage tail tape measure protein